MPAFVKAFHDPLTREPLSPQIRFELAHISRLNVTARGSLITVEPEDIVATSNRAELKVMDSSALGSEVWYGYSLRIPTAYEDGEGPAIIGQLHDGKPPSGEWIAHPPLLALRFFGDTFDVVYGLEPPRRQKKILGPLAREVWHRFVWRVQWDDQDGGAGSARIYVDGAHVHTFKGPNVYDAQPSFMKLGIYRPKGGDKAATVGVRRWDISTDPLDPKGQP